MVTSVTCVLSGHSLAGGSCCYFLRGLSGWFSQFCCFLYFPFLVLFGSAFTEISSVCSPNSSLEDFFPLPYFKFPRTLLVCSLNLSACAPSRVAFNFPDGITHGYVVYFCAVCFLQAASKKNLWGFRFHDMGFPEMPGRLWLPMRIEAPHACVGLAHCGLPSRAIWLISEGTAGVRMFRCPHGPRVSDVPGNSLLKGSGGGLRMFI